MKDNGKLTCESASALLIPPIFLERVVLNGVFEAFLVGANPLDPLDCGSVRQERHDSSRGDAFEKAAIEPLGEVELRFHASTIT